MSSELSDSDNRSEAARAEALKQAFQQRYGSAPVFISRAPGRVNLIGEHTDYNGGFVFPAAIDRTVLLAVAPAENGAAPGEVRLASLAFEGEVRFSLTTIEKAPPAQRWTNYVRGVAWALQERGLLNVSSLAGARILIDSNVPLGAGLSSSAALEVASALALFRLSNLPLAPTGRPALALACQLAENAFVGAKTGIMDQFISALGQSDSALLLDTRSLEYRAVPLNFAAHGLKLVAVDSAVKHSHETGGYNQRRAECEAAARFLANAYQMPEAAQLRDFSFDQLAALSATMPDLPFRRARHVLTEDARTLNAVELLESGFNSEQDLTAFGQLLRQSHESLRDDFEVTVPETDLLAELAWQTPGVIGARMTGGGFGGCTVNVVRADALATFNQRVVEEYRRRTGQPARLFIFDAVEGGSILP